MRNPRNSVRASEPVTSRDGWGIALTRGACFTLFLLAASLAAREAGAQVPPPLPPPTHTDFDLTKLLDPAVPANFAAGQDLFPELTSNGLPQPPLWACDDVGRKDRDEDGLDIPSPSIAFDTVKLIESGVRSRVGLARERLRRIGYLEKLTANYRLQAQELKDRLPPQNDEAAALEKKADELLKFVEKHKPLNGAIVQNGGLILGRVVRLRGLIKQAVAKEREAGRGAKRCALERADIDANALNGTVSLGPAPDFGPLWGHDQADIPRPFKLEPHTCTDVRDGDLEAQRKTSSKLLETLKSLEATVMKHLKAIIGREGANLQIENFATGLDIKVTAERTLRGRLQAIFQKDRRSGGPIRRLWEAIMQEILDLKAAVLQAEKAETREASRLQRCERP